MSGVFLFCFDLEIVAKIKIDLASTHSYRNQVFTFLLITRDLNKIKKNPEQLFAEIVR